MRATSTRYSKRQVYVAGILVLSGVFLYHGMCSLNNNPSSAAGEAAVKAAVADTSCEWGEGGPELFVIRHNENHPKGECGREWLPMDAITGHCAWIDCCGNGKRRA